MLTYALGVLAACSNAVSSVLQRKANREAPQGQNLSLKLIWSLAHEPVWFGGVLAITAGFLLQAAALGGGELSIVEPILVLELPATLILASRVFGARMHKREWGATAAMTAGLAGMLYFLSPSAGRTENVRWYAWTAGIGVSLTFVAVMVAWGRRDLAGGVHKGSTRQAAVLAVAAGPTFGLTAALMKGLPRTSPQRMVHRPGGRQRPGHGIRCDHAGPLPALVRPGRAAAGTRASRQRPETGGQRCAPRGRAHHDPGQLSGQVGMSSRPKVELVT
jgi:drug/metabolite transporter (DMT)-like permease